VGKMTGKVALISGGAEGIGGTVAALFVAEGGSVMLGDLQLDKAKAHAAALGPNADAVQLDVRDLAQWEAAVAAALARFGKLTTLCNIAGISEPGNTVDVDLDSWERHIAINLTGSFYGCRAAIPALAASGEAATIVNIGSMLAHRAAGGMAAYCASKAGVTHLTKSVALDCAERGLNIRANTVHPGAIRTPMYDRYLNAGGATPEQIEAVMASAHPMGRVGTPDEVAKAILFLSCDDSSFTSGTDLNVDGASAIRS